MQRAQISNWAAPCRHIDEKKNAKRERALSLWFPCSCRCRQRFGRPRFAAKVTLLSLWIGNKATHLADAQSRFFYSFTRVSIAIQFTSQVLPPSVENDCSNLQDSGLMSEMMKRTSTGRPLKSS